MEMASNPHRNPGTAVTLTLMFQRPTCSHLQASPGHRKLQSCDQQKQTVYRDILARHTYLYSL